MSNQELQNQSGENEEAGVDKRRRFIKGAGIAAPVALTLTSPSVFGALCLSEMMSGNTSLTGTGSCRLGLSPGFWRNPVGFIENVGTIAAWSKAGFVYGTHNGTGLPQRCASYAGGTSFSEVFGGGDARPMREILCVGSPADKSSGAWHIIAAILNAGYFNGTYILTPDQVKGLWNKSCPLPPPYANLQDFLDSTWT